MMEIHPERSELTSLHKDDRARLRPWVGVGLVVALVMLLMILGCASERYMTKEQDEEMRANCAEHGCTVIPNPVWQQIEQVLKRLGMLGA